uniref:Uncharacterized protein n=1 Tax=Solanum lycopersicum TaxID=4081 RepID=A0A494GA47_SOLLC
PYATKDERIIEIHGEGLKVLDAFDVVVRILRKFLTDHSMIPVFEKMYKANISYDRLADSWDDKPHSSKFQPCGPTPTSQAATVSDYSFSTKQDPYLIVKLPWTPNSRDMERILGLVAYILLWLAELVI